MTEQKLPPLYSLTQIGIATFLGSSLAAGYMLASNYAALGQRRMAIYSLWGSLVLVLGFVLLPLWRTVVVGIGASFVLVFVWALLVGLFGGELLQPPGPTPGPAPTL